MITVEKTDTDVRVTIPRNAVPPKQLNAFLDWLRLEEIAQRSGFPEEEAEATRTAATTRATAAGSGVPSASVNSRCAAPIRVGASVLISASAATRPRSRSAAR